MRGFVGVRSGMLMAPVFTILFWSIGNSSDNRAHGIDRSRAIAPLNSSVDRVASDHSNGYGSGIIYACWYLVIGHGRCGTDGPWNLRCGADICAFAYEGWQYKGPKRLGFTLGVGTVSGMLMAATSLGNPPVMLYLLSGTDCAATNRANFTGYFGITLVTLISMMLLKGLIDLYAVIRATVMLPGYGISVWFGARFFQKADDALYRRIALGLLPGAAVFGVLR